jgi:hypothetical protein
MLRRRKRLKIQEWRVPPCRGYFTEEEEGRFSLVFEKLNPKATIVTLRQLFIKSGSNKPSLVQRVRIMRTLHSAVESLHLNGIAHQGMRPDSVFFFEAKDDASEPGMDPYISGFGYPDLACYEDTENLEVFGNARLFLYQHPRHL